ncbi:MAG: endonuclease V [Desulfobulbaceae bacterium]|nr:endonuclease V [Desulfobulbaceae bacterium]
MYLCVDVHYSETGALAAGVVFEEIDSCVITGEYIKKISRVSDYSPGHFYKRELPAILELLREVEHGIKTIIIDGYVWLSTDMRPGLGAHLYTALARKIQVIGVAKNAYKNASMAALLYRGRSRKPLYVTAAGMENELAVHLVKKMHGPHRLPTQLKYVDRLSRMSSFT